MGGVGLRRLSAVLLLVLALGLVSLGLVVDLRAAALAMSGALIGAFVATVDVDKLIGRE